MFNFIHSFSPALGGVFVPIVLYHNEESIEELVRQARLKGVDMDSILKQTGLKVDVRGKPEQDVAQAMSDHIGISMARK